MMCSTLQYVCYGQINEEAIYVGEMMAKEVINGCVEYKC